MPVPTSPFTLTGTRACHRLRQGLSALLMVMLVLTTGFGTLDAHAKKKKKDAVDPQAEAKLKEGLEPLATTMGELLVKIQSRALFSPEDSGQMADIRFKLMDLMKQHPKNAMLIQPIYQAGVLHQKRGAYDEAFELYSFLISNFAEDPYALRAKSEIQGMRRRLGNNYFPAQSIFDKPEEAVEKKPEKK